MLAACRELLFQDGYHATTVRAVAERAGVAAITVYKVFGGKPGLVKALWDITLAGDDEQVPMGDRPQILEVLRTREPVAKFWLYAAFVRGIHERIAPLFTLLTQAGPEVGEVLEVGERRAAHRRHRVRRTPRRGRRAQFRTRIRLPGGRLWALAGPQLYTQLTAGRGWSADMYEESLADPLTATLLPPSRHGR